jgi:hypothetical protein
MKTAASRRGIGQAGSVLIPALLFATISFFGVFPDSAMAQDVAIDSLLPPNTLIFSQTENAALASEQFKTMPFYKILQEKEVLDFLEKPKKYVQEALLQLKAEASKDEAIKGLGLDFEKFTDVEMGQCFFAMTHVTLPEEFGPGPESMIPDIGIVFGVEFLDPEKNLFEYIKNALFSFAGSKGFPIQTVLSEYKGIPFEKVILPLPFPVATPCFFKIGKINVFCTSVKTAEEMLDRYTGSETESLADCESYRDGLKRVDSGDPAATIEYVNANAMASLLEESIVFLFKAKQMSEKGNEGEMEEIDRLFKNFPEKLGKLLDISGIRNLDAVFCSKISRDGLATSVEYTAYCGPRKGFFSLCPEIPISEDKLKMIPQDAVSFGIAHFDLSGLYDLILEGVKVFDEGIHAQVVGGLNWFSATLAGEEGDGAIDIRNDILGSLGNEYITYSLKSKGMAMMGTPPVFFYVGVKDYARFSGAVKKLFNGVRNINPEAASAFSFNSIDYEGHEICYLKFQQIPLPMQPSFTNVGDYVVFSLDAKELKRLIKKFGKSEKSILDNEDFLSHYKRLPQGKDLYSISYTNVAESFGSTYESITPMIPMMTMALPPEIDLPIDFMLLPTSECITKHLFSSMSASYKEGDGVIGVKYGPFGTEIGQIVAPALVGGIAAGLFLYKDMEMKNRTALTEEFEEIEELVDPAILAKKDMGSLAGACMVYNIENGTYPSCLEDLLKPTEAYADGFYTKKELPLDPWKNSYRYKKFTDGNHKYMIWSCGPNGADDGGKGDDIAKLK